MKLNYIIPEIKSQRTIQMTSPTLGSRDKNMGRVTLFMTTLWIIMVIEIGKNTAYFSNYTWALYVSIFYGLILPLGVFLSDIESHVMVHNLMPLNTILFLLIFWRENILVVALLNSIISYLLVLLIFVAKN